MSGKNSQSPIFFKIFESVPDLYLILSPELRIITASDAYLAATFRTREEISGKYVFEAFPDNPDTLEANSVKNLEASLKEALNTKKPQHMMMQRYDIPVSDTLGGGFVEKYWEPTNTPVLDEDGKVAYIIHKVIDVTERIKNLEEIQLLIANEKAAILEAKWAQERLHDILIQSPVGICIFRGKDHVIELANPAFCQITGRELDKIIKKPVFDSFPESEKQGYATIFNEVYATGKTIELKEIEASLQKGKELVKGYYNTMYQPMFSPGGEIIGIIQILTDVTQHVEARIQIEQNEKKLRLLTDSLPVLIGYLDKEERYQFANKAYESWFNRDPQTLIGQKVRDIVGEKAYSNVKTYIDRALAGERLDFEASMPYREGFTKHIRTSYVPDTREGEVKGFFTLVQDVTESVEARKKAELSEQEAQELARKLASTNKELIDAYEQLQASNEELIQNNQKLRHINEDMDNFIYTASHDLKAPINNIEGLMNAMLKHLPEETRQDQLITKIAGLITDSVDRFKGTIYDLTQITKIQRGGAEENDTQIDLAQIIQEVKLDLAPQIENSQTTFDVQLMENCLINFSSKNARSIVYNLVSNAIKYAAPGRKPFVKITCQAEGDFTLLTVEDNGLGMNLSDQKKIFSMFKRLHDHVEGTGVGLYIVKKIIENAGGKIEVESQLDKGSVFRVYFKRDRK